MYESYFGFSQRPFASVPQVEQYFPGAAIEAARVTLARCIERGEGAGMLVGPSGMGKTLLCQVLADQFRELFQVALLSSGRLSSRRALLQAIRYELGQPYRGMDEGELRLALVDHLTLGENCRGGLLLVVDEAHTLPLRLLDEIRMLTNLAHRGQPRVRLVLAGGTALEERLASPKLDSFSQRLAARCYLESFSRAETQDYIHARIRAVGGAADALLPEATCQTVHRATDGVPRLINQVCDHALLLACVAARRQLEPAQIEEAWADLQQLPTPWNGESRDRASGAVVEFGRLEDSPTEADSAPGTAAMGEAPTSESSSSAAAQPQQDSLGSEPIDTRDLEPTVQLQRIEHLLAAAEEDFGPTGSTGPEVELIFDEPVYPFVEEFEEEEIVVDRYAMGGTLRSVPSTVEQQGAAEFGWQQKTSTSSAQAAATQCEACPNTMPLCHPQPLASLESDDQDIPVVEDGHKDADSLPTSPVLAASRHQYSRLFARLRQG